MSTPLSTDANASAFAVVDDLGIPAACGLSPGAGTVTLLDFDGTRFVASGSATAFNWTDRAIPGGSTALLVRAYSAWFITAVDC